jgi:hypothetical protein
MVLTATLNRSATLLLGIHAAIAHLDTSFRDEVKDGLGFDAADRGEQKKSYWFSSPPRGRNDSASASSEGKKDSSIPLRLLLSLLKMLFNVLADKTRPKMGSTAARKNRD